LNSEDLKGESSIMKKIEVKKVAPTSAFKATMYLAFIPMGIIFLIGIISALVGVALGETEVLLFGIAYTFVPFIMLGIYGLLSILIALIYNLFAGKFGGLVLTINELDNELDKDKDKDKEE
jgi:hypothetical protein